MWRAGSPTLAGVAALRALSERHQDHVAPIEYEADLRYPGAPESRQAEGGQTVRRLLSAYGRDPLYAQWATDPAIGRGWRAISARRRCCPPCTTTAS